MNEASWVAAAQGCDSVLHVASPVPVVQPSRMKTTLLSQPLWRSLNVLKAATASIKQGGSHIMRGRSHVGKSGQRHFHRSRRARL